MKRWQSERSMRNAPALSEDKLQEMQYIIAEAIAKGSRICLTQFGTNGDTVLEGIPLYDGKLRMITDDGIQVVGLGRLIKVDCI